MSHSRAARRRQTPTRWKAHAPVRAYPRAVSSTHESACTCACAPCACAPCACAPRSSLRSGKRRSKRDDSEVRSLTHSKLTNN
eukprot:5769342-Pleurochrysis_carterae.AAC.1